MSVFPFAGLVVTTLGLICTTVSLATDYWAETDNVSFF